MQTIIVKESRNETINANLQFIVLINRTRLDGIRSETYFGAVQRMEVLKKIFQYSKWEIIVIEN